MSETPPSEHASIDILRHQIASAEERVQSREADAGWFSRLIFQWISDLLRVREVGNQYGIFQSS